MIHFLSHFRHENQSTKKVISKFQTIYGNTHEEQTVRKIYYDMRPSPYQPLMNHFQFDYDDWKSDPTNFSIPLDSKKDCITIFASHFLHPNGTSLDDIYHSFSQWLPTINHNRPITSQTFQNLYPNIRNSIPDPILDLKTIAKENQELAMKIFMKEFPW